MGQKTGAPHEHLFWRVGGGAKFAVREGDWKLVAEDASRPQLFNLADDVGESNDLAAEHPEILARLRRAYDAWNAKNIAPVFQSPRPNQPKKAAARNKS